MGIKGKINFLNSTFNYYLKVVYTYLLFKSTYKIKRGYIHKSKYHYFDDTANTDSWQLEVYTKAKDYAEKENLHSIIDFGCGSAYKLIKYFNNYETTGIDLSPTYEFLKEKYPDGHWLKFGDFDMESLSADIVICSDVIEHVLDPDDLLNNIKKIKDVKYIFISTPDRNLNPSKKFGPPFNPSHIREWTFEELNEYVSAHFDIIEHLISNRKQWTQLIIAKNKA
ncbi:MAG: methyltransferase domain-containing protein [Flavobacteriaceae bacterium]|nr:methyltransferase domain-containing protein [Flavobacteriaceae bacterium]